MFNPYIFPTCPIFPGKSQHFNVPHRRFPRRLVQLCRITFFRRPEPIQGVAIHIAIEMNICVTHIYIYVILYYIYVYLFFYIILHHITLYHIYILHNIILYCIVLYYIYYIILYKDSLTYIYIYIYIIIYIWCPKISKMMVLPNHPSHGWPFWY